MFTSSRGHSHTEFTLNPRMQLAILPILITAIHSLSIRVTGKQLLTTQTPTWRTTLPHTRSAGAGEIQINTLSQLIKAHNTQQTLFKPNTQETVRKSPSH